MTTDPSTMSWAATWTGPKVQVTLAQGDKTLFVDKCDATSAESRSRLLDRVVERFPAVDRHLIEARLMAMAAESPPKSSEESTFALPPSPAPWDAAVRGADLIEEIVDILKRHIVLPEHAPVAIALWVIHTYVSEQFTYSPRLLVSSPEKRCGKSLLLRFVAALVARPLPCESITTAALFRSIEKFAPTVIIDEADTILAGRNVNEELRGVINAGFARGGCVLRCVGDDCELARFRVFGPLALGMIGKPPGTIEDRSVPVLMRRRRPGELIEKLSPGRPVSELLHDTLRRIVRWTTDHGDAFATALPQVPAELDDRAGDCWFSLLAIADAAGGPWSDRARRAAVALSSGRGGVDSHALELLADLRQVFHEQKVDRLKTETILELLIQKDDRPWPDYRSGKSINARQLARLLEPFDVRPDKWKSNDVTERGYFAEAMGDAWGRYLPAAPSGGSRSATPPPASNQAGSKAAAPDGEWQMDPPPGGPPGGAVADGGGSVAAGGVGTSPRDAEQWRQVADGDAQPQSAPRIDVRIHVATRMTQEVAS